MRLSQPRIAPVADPATLDDDSRALLAGYETGHAVNIFRTLVRHPKLFKRWGTFATHVLVRTTLPARDRELLILRTGWLCRAEYEWGQHVVIARQAGCSDAEIDGVAAGPEHPGWDRFDASLLRAADELHAASMISDGTWETLSERYSVQQLMDVVFTVGQYTLVSMALNSFGVQLEPGVAGFPG